MMELKKYILLVLLSVLVVFSCTDEDLVPEPEPESDDEVSVEPFTLDGVDYYLDTDSNELYDTDTQQVIGKLVDGKIVKL